MRRAIMDIGYNAIRAVVYEDNTLGAPEIFNKYRVLWIYSTLQMVLGIKKEITFRNIFNGTDILRSSGSSGNQFNGKNF